MKQELLKQAIDALEAYLNAGHKEARREASIKAKEVHKQYYGTPYKNKLG